MDKDYWRNARPTEKLRVAGTLRSVLMGSDWLPLFLSRSIQMSNHPKGARQAHPGPRLSFPLAPNLGLQEELRNVGAIKSRYQVCAAPIVVPIARARAQDAWVCRPRKKHPAGEGS